MTRLDRRSFLAASGAAAATAACSPAAAPLTGEVASDKAGWEREWDELVLAAKREGQLALITTVGSQYRQCVEAFEKAFPGITVEHQGIQASIFAPRVLQERASGIYSYDVITTTYGTVPLTLIPQGVMDPVRPLMFRPDVLDDAIWREGFEAGFPDNDKRWGYASMVVKSRHFWVNTTLVREGEITRVEDLTNPKWKGRILSADPRTHGGGWWPGTFMRMGTRDDTIMKRIWKDQEATLSRDARQMTEMMVKGQYAIGIGAVNERVFVEFLAEGLGKNLKPIELDYGDHLSGGSDLVYYFNRAPHPNAARLFVNWFLSKEGQTAWAKLVELNSRRVDVEPANPHLMPTPGKTYPDADKEGHLDEYRKTQDLAKAALN